MIKIGITGNIGSGKTTVCQIFEQLDIPIYYADARAKSLMQSSSQLISEIQETFGKDMYLENGVLDREKLANRVFSDEEALRTLNKLVHPIVFEDIQKWMQQNEKNNKKIAIEEAALTFEAGHSSYFDLMITVVAPERKLLERVVQRDKVKRKEVQQRLDRQWPQHKKALQSDIIILNDGAHSLIFQVQNIIDRWHLPVSKSIDKS
jgi:dephospho-CoA kinase